MTPAGAFDRVDIQALDATGGGFSWLTGFLVAEIKACAATASTCTTSLASGGNNCT